MDDVNFVMEGTKQERVKAVSRSAKFSATFVLEDGDDFTRVMQGSSSKHLFNKGVHLHLSNLIFSF